jgi:membrane-bound ClpP family serine protease
MKSIPTIALAGEEFMKNLTLVAVLSISFVFIATGTADTFTHKTEGAVYHGYLLEDMRNGKHVAITQEKGEIELSLNDYKVEYNATGRNNIISQLHIVGVIESEIVMEAFISALKETSNSGPLMILIEIDSPGGRVDQCKKMVAAISDVTHTEVVAYIKGGENGGAYSAGAVLSMACDKIYMNGATSMGAATMIAGNRSMKDLYGKDVGAKFDAAWRNYVAAVAEKNGYPPAIARAMVTKEVVVIEVERDGEKLYIEPKDKKESDKELREICKDGDILAITAMEAVEYGVATGIYDYQSELLSDLGYSNAQVVQNEKLAQALKVQDKILRKLDKMYAKIAQYQMTLDIQISVNPRAAKETLKKLIKSLEYLLVFEEKEQDVPISRQSIELAIAQYKAIHDGLDAMR